MLPSVDNGTFTATGYDTLQLLQRLGFELFLYHGSRSDEIIVMMRAPIEVLQLKAESLKNFKLPLDPDAAERALSVGNEENGINSTTIPHRPDITTLLPFDYIYANYNKNVSELLYFRPLSVNSPFHSDIVKLKLEHKLLKTKLSNGNLVVDIDYLRMTNAVKACFPLHNLDKHKRLAIMVTNYPFRKLPIDEIRGKF